MAEKKYIELEAVLEFVEPDARPFLAKRIKSIPAADVRPVVRGHKVTHNRPIAGHWADGELYVESDGTESRVWVMPIMDNPVDYCSECGKRLDDTFQNFCPNCGADMRDRPSAPFDEVWERLKNESAESREFFEAAERMADEEQPSCDTCVHYPPSSCDGKPCTQCDPNSRWANCYQKREGQT